MGSGVCALALQIWGESVLGLHTSDDGILQQAFAAKSGMVLCIMPYAVMMCLLGALRGAGLQTWGAIALAVAFYIIGLPTSAYLALDTDTGLLGLTLGNALGLFVAAASMACRIVWVNWEGVVKNASASADLTESLQKDSVAGAPESSDAQRSIRLEA